MDGAAVVGLVSITGWVWVERSSFLSSAGGMFWSWIRVRDGVDFFCRRDDWGRENMNDGIEIGLYQHEEATFRAHQQHVWILHLELSARERPNVEPLQPGRFRVFDA